MATDTTELRFARIESRLTTIEERLGYLHEDIRDLRKDIRQVLIFVAGSWVTLFAAMIVLFRH